MPDCNGSKKQCDEAIRELAELRKDRARLEAHVAQLRQALRLAINTVECASLDTDLVTELPWYANAKAALRETGGLDQHA
jgi:hypothetical protein